jgi:hypothetical protein
MPQPQWLIEGLFEVNGLVMLAGPPGNYKSFLALDWLLCMSTGLKWCNRLTTPAKTLYVLGEGKASLLKRMETWITYNDLGEREMERLKENFRVTFNVPQMASKASTDNLLNDLENENFHPSVIVIDTFARSFVGLDENSQKDTGLWIESAERLREKGMAVIFLHHTKKNMDYGLQYRGSSAIMGAMDTAMVLSKDGQSARVVLKVVKQKDHEEAKPMTFIRQVIGSSREEGSVVLVPAPSIDERFTVEGQHIDEVIKQLIRDDTFESDRARSRILVTSYGFTDSAAQSRVAAMKKRMEKEKDNEQALVTR